MTGFSVPGKPRRAVYVVRDASRPSLAIPAWAQGGRGIAYVSGVGGGASGAVGVTSGQRGTGGGSGAVALRHPMLIAGGLTTLSAVLGSAGAAVTATVGTDGNAGGNTVVTIGTNVLTLEGAPSTSSGDYAKAYMGTSAPSAAGGNLQRQFSTISTTSSVLSGLAALSTLQYGTLGGFGSNLQNGFGQGGLSPYGAGGAHLTAGPTVTTAGGDATGYGAGGAGALSVSGGSVTSGAGTMGLLIIEIEEVAP